MSMRSRGFRSGVEGRFAYLAMAAVLFAAVPWVVGCASPGARHRVDASPVVRALDMDPADDYDWTATAYHAWGARDDIGEIAIGQVTIDEHDTLTAPAVGRKRGEGEPLSFLGLDTQVLYGLEGLVASREDQDRDERYGEYAVAFTTRFNDFPWREVVHTFFEGGVGVSYAEHIPAIEVERRDDKVNHLLAYLKLQLGVGIPRTPIDLVGVLHHRSGAWGTFDGASGGSNFLGLGLQARF